MALALARVKRKLDETDTWREYLIGAGSGSRVSGAGKGKWSG